MSVDQQLKLRPKMDRWLRDRGFGPAFLAERWKISRQGASRYLLPFEDPKRIIPSPEKMADLLALTRGEVVAADWYPPELSGAVLPASIGWEVQP